MNNSSNLNSNVLFLGICIGLIVVFIILFLFIKGKNQELKLKFEKNTFFVELDNPKNQPFNAYTDDPIICVKGNNRPSRTIENEVLKIPSNNPQFLLMFWIKINSKDVIKDKPKDPSYYKNPVITPTINLNKLLNFNNTDLQIKLITQSARIEFQHGVSALNDKSILSNIPYDKWICLGVFYTEKYLEIYLNGKLAETMVYKEDSGSSVTPQTNIDIGKFPGDLAYLVVSVKEKYFNAYSIYQEYLYYKEKIDKSERYRDQLDNELKLDLFDSNDLDLYPNSKKNTCSN